MDRAEIDPSIRYADRRLAAAAEAYFAEWSERYPHIIPEGGASAERLLAIEESGHATWHYLGFARDLAIVTIIPNDKFHGRVEPVNSAPNVEAAIAALANTPWDIRQFMLANGISIALAGQASRLLLRGQDFFDWTNTGDLRAARALGRHLYGLSDSILERHYEFVRDWIAQPRVWAGVTEMAELLLARRALAGADAYAILDRHISDLKATVTTPVFKVGT